MEIYDVTVAVSPNTPVYTGDPGVEFELRHAIARGDTANVSFLQFGAHTGTHVDAPVHFVEGAGKVDALPLDVLIGRVRVIELPDDVMAIDAELISQANFENVTRVIFKTRNSAFWGETEKGFREDFTYIDETAAKFLVEKNIKLVGIDYLSVEKFGATSFGTHTTLLKNNVVIIEGLDLRGVMPGDYELICLPLKLSGGAGDGAPARTILREIDQQISF